MKIRIPTLLATVFVVLFAAATAGAQTFSLTGRHATGSGAFLKFPIIGTPCPSITGNVAVPTTIPQNYRAPITQSMAVLNPGGCVGAAATTITTTGSGGFALPVKFFSKPAPGVINVAPVPATGMVVQVATSFAFTAPNMLNTPFTAQNPVKLGTSKFVAAQWNLFRPNAHLTAAGMTGASTFTKNATNLVTPGAATPQGLTTVTRNTLNAYVSGRTSKDFTACPTMVAANVACTFPNQGAIPGVVRNIAGSNVFGGTMGLVISTGGANTSNVAVTLAPIMSGPVLLNALSGGTSRAPGRGYAATNNIPLLAGQVFMNHMLTTLTPMTAYRVLGMVTGYVGPGAGGNNQNYGFPWTTGTVLVRATGTTMGGGPGGATFSLMGYDNRTAMGLGNIQLVAGGIAQSSLQASQGTATYSVMRLELAPEPGAIAGLLAGAALLGAVAWRRRH